METNSVFLAHKQLRLMVTLRNGVYALIFQNYFLQKRKAEVVVKNSSKYPQSSLVHSTRFLITLT